MSRKPKPVARPDVPATMEEFEELFEREGPRIISLVRQHHPSLYVKAISALADFGD